MNFSKSGEVIYLEEGHMYTWDGSEIVKPAICIDDDSLVFWGNIEDVKLKYVKLLERFRESDVDVSSIKVIPLFEKLNIDDCYFIIEVANNYTSCGFLRNLSSLFNTDKLLDWLSNEKVCKKF